MIEAVHLLITVAAIFAIGNKAYDLLKLKKECLIEEFVFSFTLGIFVATNVIFVIGILGNYYNRMFLLLLLLSLTVCHKNILRLMEMAAVTLKKEKRFNANFDFLLKLTLLIFLLLNFAAALAPPRSSDEIWYQLAVPKQYIKNHRIVYLPSMPWAELPNAMQMLFLPVMLLGNGTTAKMLIFAITAVFALAVYSFTRKIATKRAGLIAATVFYTMPIVSLYNVRGFIDLPAAFFGFSAVYAFYYWHKDKENKWLIVTAVMAGLAAATKANNTAVAQVMMLGIAYSCRKNLKEMIKSGIIFCAIVLLILTPWLAKAYLNTGNPVYPVIFGGKYWSDELTKLYYAEQNFIGTGKGVMSFLLLPWSITMHSERFAEIMGTGPLFLAFIPLLLFAKNDETIKGLMAASLLLVFPWFFTAQNIRYLLTMFSLLSVIAGYSFEALKKEKITTAMALLLITVVSFNLGLWMGTNAKNIPVVFGLQSKDDYLGRYVNNYYATQYANANLPEDSLTCLYGDSRAYYFEKPFIWCMPLYQGYIDFVHLDEQELLQRFKEVGATHILIDPFKWQYDKVNQVPIRKKAIEEINVKIERTVKEHGSLLFEREGQRLYAISYNVEK